VILCATPLSVYDPAFALTFGATLGILVGSARFSSRLPHAAWLRAPLALLLASASAELALLPVGAWAFFRVTFAGLLLNFLAIPLMAVAQIAGMFVVPLAGVSPALADVAGFVAHLGAAGLIWSGTLVDLMPVLTRRVPAPGAWLVGLYYAGWLLWLASHVRGPVGPEGRRWLRTRRAGAWSGLTIVVVAAAWTLVSPLGRIRGSEPSGRLRMTVIDVGQADAILLRFPDARTLLVDTGGSRAGGRFDVGGRVLMPVLWQHDVFHLDALAITHGDPDHLGGAVALLRDVPVGELWEGVDVPRDEAVQRMHAQAAARGVRSRPLRAGDRIGWDAAEVRVWHPPPPDWERQKVRNDDSLVLDVRFGNVSLLLAGDIGAEVERPLARTLRLADLRVLKVPHHGSAGSSTPPFIAATRPSMAVFTIGAVAGAARPALDAVIGRYRAAGAAILRTDADGAIEIETDGREVNVETAGGRNLTIKN
jgi:competence protein ComEC